MTRHHEAKLERLSLSTGPTWTSFERLRIAGSKAPLTIKANTTGCLVTKTSQYRILHEADFQRLLGLASEVERVTSGLRAVALAVELVKQHCDEANLEQLSTALSALTEDLALPTRAGHDALETRVEPEAALANSSAVREEDGIDLVVSTALRPINKPQPVEAADGEAERL